MKISKFYRIVNWKPKASLALRIEAKTNPGLLQADSQKMKAARVWEVGQGIKMERKARNRI